MHVNVCGVVSGGPFPQQEQVEHVVTGLTAGRGQGQGWPETLVHSLGEQMNKYCDYL